MPFVIAAAVVEPRLSQWSGPYRSVARAPDQQISSSVSERIRCYSRGRAAYHLTEASSWATTLFGFGYVAFLGYCEAHWGSLLFTIGSALLCLETYAPYYRRPGATSVAASLWWGSVVFLLSSLAFMAEDYGLWASGSASQLRSKEASDTLAHCLSYPGLTHADPAFAALLPCMSPWAAPSGVGQRDHAAGPRRLHPWLDERRVRHVSAPAADAACKGGLG